MPYVIYYTESQAFQQGKKGYRLRDRTENLQEARVYLRKNNASLSAKYGKRYWHRDKYEIWEVTLFPNRQYQP
jgi:hypothetical protein